MRAPPRRALLRAAACAALAACVSAAEPAETDSAWRGWTLGERPAFGLATHAAKLREVREATAQGGRGLVTETPLSADAAPTDTHARESADAESGDVARDVRSREPRVRDAREDTLARILSLSEGLPRDARDAVERAVAVARGASDLQLILDDLAGAAAHALRDEAYWRGEAGTAAAANDSSSPAYVASSASAASAASAFDFRARGRYRVVVEKRTFYWPPLGFDFAERVTPWVTAVVYLPEAEASAIPNPGPFPAVAFAVGWNSWVERYDETMRHLASHGFVVIAPTVADRRARPLFSFDLLSKHLLASLAWLVRESRRRSSALFFGKIDVAKLGLLGHSSGAGAAVRAAVDAKLRVAASSVPSTHDPSRAFGSSSFSSESGSSEDTDALHALVSTGIRAVAGVGAFLESSGLDHDALANLRGVAMFQLAGRRDSHVTPRAVADIAAAAVHAAPRAVAVLRYGTHCFLDEASEYEYPDSQCAAALRGESRFFLRDVPRGSSSVSESTQWAFFENDVDADRNDNDASSLQPDSASVMSPAAQLEATREYLAAFYVAELRGSPRDGDLFVFGDEDTEDESSFFAFERACVSEARRKMWGVQDDDGRRRGAATHSSLARGGAGGWGNGDTVDDASTEYASRSRSLSLRAASPVERTGMESFGEPPPADVTLAEDPRMSRVEVLAWR